MVLLLLLLDAAAALFDVGLNLLDRLIRAVAQVDLRVPVRVLGQGLMVIDHDLHHALLLVLVESRHF